MSDYKNQPIRPVDMGINLVMASDSLEPGRWVSLHNVEPVQEALLPTRLGRRTALNTGTGAAIHSLIRLSSSALLSGVGNKLYRDNAEIATGFSGSPLSFVSGPNGLIFVGDLARLAIVDTGGTVYGWGIAGPAQPAAFSATGTGTLDSSVAGASVYDWRYTYYSTKTKTESNGSPTVNGIAVVAQQGTIQVFASTDSQVNQIRLYRRGGTLSDAWRLVSILPNSNQVVNDNRPDEDIALFDQLLDTNYPPFNSEDSSGNALVRVPMPYIWGPFLGKVIFACGDPNQPNRVYWTNFHSFGSSDVNNFEEVSGTIEPLMNGWMFGSLPYIASRDAVYAIDFGNPTDPTFSARRTPVGRGISGNWAFAVGPLVYILSKDGIYETDCQSPNVRSITEKNLRPIFQGHSIEGQSIPSSSTVEPIVDDEILGPVDFTQNDKLRLTYANHEVHFFYQDTSGEPHHLIYHTGYERWRTAGMGQGVSVELGYWDVNASSSQLLLATNNGKVYVPDPLYLDDDGIAIEVKAKSGDLMNEFGFASYHNLLVESVPSGPTGLPIDISVVPTKGQFDNWGHRFIVPGESQGGATLGRSVKSRFSLVDSPTATSTPSQAAQAQFGLVFEWEGRATVRQLMLQYRKENENVLFWDSGDTTHGLTGWQHVKDLYLAMRGDNADGAYTLTQFVDGVAKEFSFEAPSSNAKSKIYIPVAARKGKLFRYRVTAPLDPSLSIQNALTASWRLEEASGTDSMGSNDLTISGSPGATEGAIGGGAHFDGTGTEYMSIADNTTLRALNSSGFSLSLWVRIDNLPIPNSMLVFKGVSGAVSATQEYYIRARSAGHFQAVVGAGASAPVVDIQTLSLNTSLGGPGITTGQWYHLVMTFNTANRTFSLYLNGVLEESEVATSPLYIGTGDFWLARTPENTTQRLYGALDAVMFWQRPLTAREVSYLYNRGFAREVYAGVPQVQDSGFGAGFNINAGECEVRAKPWNTRLGYQLINPFQPGDTPGQEP
jgi:hypothetical protein